MKILQIMPEFGLAGAEVMAENLAYGLKKQNCDVTMVSFYPLQTAITQRMTQNGLPVIFLDKRPGFDVSIIFKIRAICHSEMPDVIQTHRYVLPYVFLATLGTGIPIIHTVHNIAEKEVSNFQIKLQKILFKLKRVTPVAISPIIKNSILELYKMQECQVPMIFNGIDVNRCIPKREYKLHDGGRILHIGRFSPQKNHELLIRAFSKIHQIFPQTVLYLVGQGDLQEKIKMQVESANLEHSVKFLGPQDSVYEILNKADIFVLSSNYEGMPITIIEAMATGLPIVSTNVGGVGDMLTHNVTGVLVPVEVDALSSGMQFLLSDEEERRQIGTAALNASQRFGYETMSLEYYRLYEGAIQ